MSDGSSGPPGRPDRPSGWPPADRYLADANRGRGRRRLGEARASQLQGAVAQTIAVPELDAEAAFEVGLLLDQYDLLERQIEAADRRVASLLDGETARLLGTIPGVGPATTATLVAEIGDIARFSDFDQLLAYAGVHPAERSSGRKGANPETSWHMSKAGNSHLRRPLIGWPSWGSGTTRSSPLTMPASAPPARPR